jgi:DNA-binding response OmpR family regulator
VCVSDGQAALRESKRPDFVLVDYHLNNETGISVITQLRDKFGADLPAILVTADRSNEVKGLAAAIDVVILNKPLKPAALRAVLARGGIKDAAE